MSKSSAPSSPDFSGLIGAATQQSQQYNQIMQQELDFAKTAYNENKPFYQQAQQQDLAAQKTSNQFGADQLANYEQLYQPLQKQFVGEVSNYDSPDKAARARGQAMATVGQQYEAAGQAATRQLQSYGVDPSAARFGALDIGTRTGEAAATAAAGTQSDVNRENTAIGLQGQALNIGNSTANTGISANNSATGSGAGAVNATTSSYSPYASALGNPTAFGNLSQSALGQAGGFMQSGYQDQLANYNANQNSSSGIGSAIGTAAGLGMMFLAKGGRVPSLPHGAGAVPTDPAVRGSVPTQSAKLSPPRGMSRLSNIPTHMMFADGGAVPMAGQQVPPSMSPSGGAQTDDIPAQVGAVPGGPPQGEARINADEFIMPKDVANWIGGKQLQNMVLKARKEMGSPQQAPAQGQPAPTAPAGGGSGGPNTGAVPAGHYAHGGSVSAMGAVGGPPGAALNGNPSRPAVSGATAPPATGASRAPISRAPAPRVSRHPGYMTVGKGAGGGAGSGPAINLGGHQPPRPTNSMYGSPAGAVRSAVPGV
jgi:hypothetical protein